LTLFVGAPGSITNTGRVVNLSVLAPVSASNPIIAGFVISGSGSQSILIRAVGPGLSAVGVNDGLAAPNLKVFNAATAVIHESNSWGGSSTLSAEFARLGAFPLNAASADAAVSLSLAPGAYTLHVNASGTTSGTALAEVYDASISPAPAGTPRLVNISARGVVGSAGQLVTGGFVITGTTPRKMLIRGIGPGLTGQGVTGALSDPVVTLHKIGTGVIAQNDNWGTPLTVVSSYPAATPGEISAAATTTGAFSLAAGSSDGAILVTLAPGIYTAQVGGAGTATGAAMVEVYEVP
ncbi:MAG TPA: hypothetical protein VL069_15445, partial [Opitutus sp.]|nr:hypothetical protein [Opitutus sp.]